MADKWQALQNFWSSFDIPAYDENSVPDDAQMPYITYAAEISSFENVLLLTGSVWYRSTRWAEASQKAEEIARSLASYRLEDVNEDEYLFLTQGNPFAQRMKDEDDTVKRIYINIMAEYFSAY